MFKYKLFSLLSVTLLIFMATVLSAQAALWVTLEKAQLEVEPSPGVTLPLTSWRYAGPYAPKSMRFRFTVKNRELTAVRLLPAEIRYEILWADIAVDGMTLLMDKSALESCALWTPWTTQKVVMPVIASRETYSVLAPPVDVTGALALQAGQKVPLAVRARLSIKAAAIDKLLTIPVETSLFATPIPLSPGATRSNTP